MVASVLCESNGIDDARWAASGKVTVMGMATSNRRFVGCLGFCHDDDAAGSSSE